MSNQNLLIRRTKVESSNLASIGYAAGVLQVEFKNQSIYNYEGVPAEVAQEFLAADRNAEYENSFGKFFDREIKKAGYGYEMVQSAVKKEKAA
jgi:KTSC domain